MELEDLVRLYTSARELPLPAGETRFARWLPGGRVFLARGPGGSYEAFLAGEKASFGACRFDTNVEWNAFSAADGTTVEALCIRAADADQNHRLMAHFAYEVLSVLSRHPGVDNATLLATVAAFIEVIRERSLLDQKRQAGLTGELLLLELLLDYAAAHGLSPGRAVEAWVGWDRRAARDFARNGVVVEVKTTSKAEREHAISSVEQLELDGPEEQLLLFSMSLKRDPSGSVGLVDVIRRVRVKAGAFAAVLDEHLREYGYDARYEQQYSLETPYLTTRFAARLFVVDDTVSRLRKSSFVGGELPANVKSVEYVLSLQGVSSASNPLTGPDVESVFGRMLA